MIKLVCVATASVLAAMAATHSPNNAPARALSAGSTPTRQAAEPNLELRGALARAGLGAEELTAAGLATARLDALIERAATNDVVVSRLLGPADQILSEARNRVATLEKAIRGGDRATETVDALTAARAEAATADESVNALLDSLFASATQGLAPPVVARLRMIASNGRYRRLPIEFLVVERTAQEWADLRQHLTHERVCARRGDETDPVQIAALAQSRARSEVAAARAEWSAHLASNEAVWMAATTL